jgi:hypothetical protein
MANFALRDVKGLVAVALLGATLALAACGGGDEETAAVQNPPPPPNPPVNQPPTISGTPATQVMHGSQYTFTPTASDPNGDSLTFSIANKPSWATFTVSNGQLSGTPGAGDVRTYTSIQISVSDGPNRVSLAAFNLQVVAMATGSVTLNWTAPTQNTDGSALMNLAGYKVYWGTTQGQYPNSVTLNNPGLATYVVDQLTPATWYFAMTALNAQGAESSLSNTASKVVQ